MGEKISKVKLYATLFALGCAGGSIFLIPYIKFVFYDLQLEVTGMTNTQSALLLTVYAIFNIIAAIPGGMIMDKINNKKGVIVALFLTTIVTIIYAFTCTSFIISIVIWALLSFFTMGIYWPAFGKILNIIGAKTGVGGRSGSSFGIYYAFNGISAAILQAIALWVTTLFSDPKASFQAAICVTAASTVLAMILVIFFMDKDLIRTDGKLEESMNKDKQESKIQLSQLTTVCKNPMIWMFLVVCLVAYTMYTLQSYFTPFLTSVVGISPEASGVFAIIRTYIFLLLAPIGGLIADKLCKSIAKWFMVVFVIIAMVIVGLFVMPQGANVMFVSFYTLIPAAMVQMTYTIRYAIIGEIHIPPALMGTTVGLAASVASVADLIFGPIVGRLLDTHGNAAYYYLFGFLAFMLVMGSLASIAIVRHSKKMKQQQQIEAETV